MLSAIKQYLPRLDAEPLVRYGAVWLDDERLTDPYRVISSGETLSLFVSSHSTTIFDWKPSLKIFEDEDLLVVYKPAGVVVAQTRDSLVNNLSYAVNRYLKTSNIDYNAVALTRLDAPVRGLVIFAKNVRAHALFSDLLRTHQVTKSYLALTEETSGKFSGLIDTKLSFRKKAVVDSKGKKCITRFRRVAHCPEGVLFRVRPSTGRRHQIRAHLAGYLAPIVGDRLYGNNQKTNGIGLMADSYDFSLQGKHYRVRVQNSVERLMQELFS